MAVQIIVIAALLTGAIQLGNRSRLRGHYDGLPQRWATTRGSAGRWAIASWLDARLRMIGRAPGPWRGSCSRF